MQNSMSFWWRTFSSSSGIYSKDEVYSSLPYECIESIRGIVDKIIFNVEADTPTLYNQIMGTDVGGFDLMKKSIEDCVSSGLNVEAHIVPMRIKKTWKFLSLFAHCMTQIAER